MIRSMTGFGRARFELQGDDGASLGFDIEMRAVNHRYLDVRVKLPRLLSDREADIKARVARVLQRGKVDVSINPLAGSSSAVLVVDDALAAQYVNAGQTLSAAHQLERALDTASLLALPGVVRFGDPEFDQTQVGDRLGDGVDSAVAELDGMRLAEGRALAAEFEERLLRVLGHVDSLGSHSDQVIEAARERLRKRTEQLRQETGILDEARLHQEVVIAADRLDITEELVRLRSHVEQFRSIVGEADANSAVGRRLDFLLQEMGREANTAGSKAGDAPLAHTVVELKAELERLREQVQNVE